MRHIKLTSTHLSSVVTGMRPEREARLIFLLGLIWTHLSGSGRGFQNFRVSRIMLLEPILKEQKESAKEGQSPINTQPSRKKGMLCLNPANTSNDNSIKEYGN